MADGDQAGGLDGDLAAALDQIHGTMYRVVGQITASCSEYLQVDGVIPITVDLDAGQYPDEVLPPLAVGDLVAIVGRLCVVLEPGDVQRFSFAGCT